jgi:hypothetical protein
VNIKDQPHNLAWINEAEQDLLKDLGGSGRPGPMGIPAYDVDYDTDLDEDYESVQAGPGEPGYEGPESNQPDDVQQSRQAVADQLGRNYDPESLATPNFIDAEGNTVDVPSYGFDESGNFSELAEAIGGKPQGAFATAGEHADYFFSKKDGEVKPGVFDRGDGPPDMLAKLSPTIYAVLSAINKLTRTVDPEKEQGTKSNITFSLPPDEPRDDGNADEEIIPEIVEKKEEEKKLGTMEQFFADKKEEGVPEVLDNIINRLGIQNRTIEPFNEWLAGQSEAMRAADMITQTNEYRKSLRDQTSPAQSYLPIVQPAADRTTEQSFINNLYPSSKKTSATDALYAELGI